MTASRALVCGYACACACACACATPAASGVAGAGGAEDDVRARAETLEVVRRSLVQRVVREAPAVTRSGVARLVTMVPLDETRMTRLAPSVSRVLFAERLENETALRLERALSADDIHALGDALADDAVQAVIGAAVAADPPVHDLERFVEDPASLTEARRGRVTALVQSTWSPVVVDRLTRAPVSAAGRIVAAALKDDDGPRRDDLLRIADQARPGDPDALVVAFAFLWRDLDDATLDNAHTFFASGLGTRSTIALVNAVTAAIDALAATVERDVR